MTTSSRARRTRATAVRRRDDRGATAVEFALLVPLLILLLFGIVDYGLWFNDSLNVRQGVREAARQGVVQNINDATCTTGGKMQQLACITKSQIGAVTGDTYVKVSAPNGWERGKPLVVCGMVDADAVTGLVPLPSSGLVTSRTQMSIEVEFPVLSPTSHTDAAPAGADWTWC
jgi:Flp pilus assembly protein TadG